MRVLMVDPSGATAAVTHNLCNALVDAGCTVDLFTGPQWARSVGSLPGEVRYRPRLEYCRWTQLRSYSARRWVSRKAWQFLRFLEHHWSMFGLVRRSKRYAVVHVQWLPLPHLDVMWLRLIAARANVVYTVHNLRPHDTLAKERSWQRTLGRIYKTSDMLIAHTRHTAEGLVREFGVPQTRIRVIPHGSMQHLIEEPDDATVGLSGDQRSDEGEPIVLFFGQIRKNKGLEVLIRAASELRSRVPSFTVHVVGAPKVDMRPYEALIDELEVRDLFRLDLGYVEEQDIADLFRKAAVVALPYLTIDQSGVALTALTFGRCVVASRCGGLEDLVQESRGGLLVTPGDHEELATALTRVLLDDDLRRDCEKNARRYVEVDLSWERLARETIEVYQAAQ